MAENWIIAFATSVLAIFAAIQIYRELHGERRAHLVSATVKAYEQINRFVFDDKIVELFGRWRIIRAKHTESIEFNSVWQSFERHKEYVKDSGSANAKATHDYDCIIQLLNFYEVIAIGIRNGVVNELIIRDWWRTSTVADWARLYSFVREYRKHQQSSVLFEYYEWLANRWATESERAHLAHLSTLMETRHE